MKELKNLQTSNDKKLLVVLPLNKVIDVQLNECIYSLANQEYPVDLLVLTNGLNDGQKKQLNEILEKPTVKIRTQNESGEPKEDVYVSEKKLNYIIEETDKVEFSAVFNEAFNYADVNCYEWVSVIEYEDVIDFKWYKNFKTFSEEKTDIGCFVPITREINNGVFTGFFNESSWGEGMSEVAGYFDLQLMLKYNCMNLTGAVLKVDNIKEYSEKIDEVLKPIKESIKISYAYEFVLRMIYEDVKFYTIPRVGYERRTGFYSEYDKFMFKLPQNLSSIPVEKGGMNEEELRFWLDLARKEYFFEEDRNETYVTLNLQQEVSL